MSVQVGQVGWCASPVVWCCCSKDRCLLFPLIWFRAWESSGLPMHFFQSRALLHDGFWPSESGYKKSSKNSLCVTWISLATKVNQWLSYYTFLFHRITLSVVTVPNELFCPHSHWNQVHTLPAFHTGKHTPCVVSVLPSCPVKWNSL